MKSYVLMCGKRMKDSIYIHPMEVFATKREAKIRMLELEVSKPRQDFWIHPIKQGN